MGHFKNKKIKVQKDAINQIIQNFEKDLGNWIGLHENESMVYKHSIMRSIHDLPQRPHFDFMIEDLPEESCFYNVILPLTSKGSFLEV